MYHLLQLLVLLGMGKLFGINSKSLMIRFLPCNLLVRGDFVLLGLGEKAPAKVKCIVQPNLILEKHQILKPSLLAAPIEELADRGKVGELVKFQVLETQIKVTHQRV
jgi:hypothetical protein